MSTANDTPLAITFHDCDLPGLELDAPAALAHLERWAKIVGLGRDETLELITSGEPPVASWFNAVQEEVASIIEGQRRTGLFDMVTGEGAGR